MISITNRYRTAALAATLAAAAIAKTTAEEPRVVFPEGYRSWFHVKSATIDEGNPAFAVRGGIHHIYANDLARKGYETGIFANGSVIAFDELQLKVNENHTSTEGPRKRVDVMVRDAERFKETDGWGYESFMLDSRSGSLTPAQVKACATCHANRKDHGFVFSSVRP